MMFQTTPTDEQLKQVDDELLKTYHSSSFLFLRETRGLRPSFLSVMMGTSGCGKSTLIKSLIAETSEKTKTLVLATEEEPIFYSRALTKCKGYNKDNIIFAHEKNFEKDKVQRCSHDVFEAIDRYKKMIIMSNAKVVFYDNITTSVIYENLGNAGQSAFVGALTEIAEQLKIVIFCVAHTNKKVSDNVDRLLSGDDVRYSNQLYMKAGYFYIMQRFALNQKFFTFIRIRKHRGEEGDMHKDFALVYQKGLYVRDLKIEHDDINEMFKQRNRLTDKKKKT